MQYYHLTHKDQCMERCGTTSTRHSRDGKRLGGDHHYQLLKCVRVLRLSGFHSQTMTGRLQPWSCRMDVASRVRSMVLFARGLAAHLSFPSSSSPSLSYSFDPSVRCFSFLMAFHETAWSITQLLSSASCVLVVSTGDKNSRPTDSFSAAYRYRMSAHLQFPVSRLLWDTEALEVLKPTHDSSLTIFFY